MGGVSASFAFMGDVVIAEPGALIGFAGARRHQQGVGGVPIEDERLGAGDYEVIAVANRRHADAGSVPATARFELRQGDASVTRGDGRQQRKATPGERGRHW
jgi:hypothetical protein